MDQRTGVFRFLIRTELTAAAGGGKEPPPLLMANREDSIQAVQSGAAA
eukprot:gene5519-5754_t